MPRQNRVTRDNFLSLGKAKARKLGIFCSVSVYRQEGFEPKFVCIISKKMVRLSHDRNHIRRRFREAFRTQVLIAEPHAMYVFTPKKESKTATYKDICEDVKSLIECKYL